MVMRMDNDKISENRSELKFINLGSNKVCIPGIDRLNKIGDLKDKTFKSEPNHTKSGKDSE